MWAMTTANANVQDVGTSSNTAPHHPITGELQTLHCQVRLPVTTRESGHDPWVVYHLDYAWRLLWYAPHTNPHLSPHKPLCSPSLHLWVTLGFINIAMENGQFVDYLPWKKGRLTMAILPEGVGQWKNVETTQQSSNLKWVARPLLETTNPWKPPNGLLVDSTRAKKDHHPTSVLKPWNIFQTNQSNCFQDTPSHTMPDTLW